MTTSELIEIGKNIVNKYIDNDNYTFDNYLNDLKIYEERVVKHIQENKLDYKEIMSLIEIYSNSRFFKMKRQYDNTVRIGELNVSKSFLDSYSLESPSEEQIQEWMKANGYVHNCQDQ